MFTEQISRRRKTVNHIGNTLISLIVAIGVGPTFGLVIMEKHTTTAANATQIEEHIPPMVTAVNEGKIKVLAGDEGGFGRIVLPPDFAGREIWCDFVRHIATGPDIPGQFPEGDGAFLDINSRDRFGMPGEQGGADAVPGADFQNPAGLEFLQKSHHDILLGDGASFRHFGSETGPEFAEKAGMWLCDVGWHEITVGGKVCSRTKHLPIRVETANSNFAGPSCQEHFRG